MQKNELKLAIIQTELVWENIDKNLENFSIKINSISQNFDLIVLPEMFTTGFTMNVKNFSECSEGRTHKWMMDLAIKNNCAITGSIIIKEKDKYYNRLIFCKPDGSVHFYNKRHLFRMGDENKFYEPGEKKIIIEYKGWKICPLICYDLRFPVWSRNIEGYDMLIYVANWPEPRKEVWKTLLKARAIENQVYTVGVNRIGKDGRGISYSGDSSVINPTGKIISSLKPYIDGIDIISISLGELNEYRETYPVALDADKFELK